MLLNIARARRIMEREGLPWSRYARTMFIT